MSKKFATEKASNNGVHVILNPASSGGKTGDRKTEILTAIGDRLGSGFSLCVTQKPLEAAFSARKAVLDGCKLIIAVGGDGTVQETVNGFFSNGNLINPSCQLGIIDAGTGHGVSQSLNLPEELGEQVKGIAGGQIQPLDLGRVSFTDEKGRPRERYFINECQAGIGGEVVKLVKSRFKRLGGFIAFGAVTLLTALRYPNRSMALEIDGTVKTGGRFIGIVIGNGSSMAGGMKLLPDASMDDGLFDILLIHEQSVVDRLRNFPKIYSGRHLSSSKFTLYRGRRITLFSPEHVDFEADGEWLGRLPCSIEILPSVLKVRSLNSAEVCGS